MLPNTTGNKWRSSMAISVSILRIVSRGHSCKELVALPLSPSSRCNTNKIKVEVEIEIKVKADVVLGSLIENLKECAPITQLAYNFTPSIHSHHE
jgi:hypothetical protein